MISYEALSYQVLYEIQQDFNRLAESVNNTLIPLYVNESYGSFIEATVTDIDSFIRGVRKRLKALEHTILSSLMLDVDKSRESISKLDIEMGRRDIDLDKSVEGNSYKITNNIRSVHKSNFDFIQNNLGSLKNIKFDQDGNIISKKTEDGVTNFSTIFSKIKSTIDNNISGGNDNFESTCKEKFIIDGNVSIKDEVEFIRSNRYKNILAGAIKDVNIICSTYLSEVKAVIKNLKNSTNNYSEKNKYMVLKIVSNYNQVFKYEISRFIQYIGYMFDAARNKNNQARKLIDDTIQKSDLKQAVKESLEYNDDCVIDNSRIIFV